MPFSLFLIGSWLQGGGMVKAGAPMTWTTSASIWPKCMQEIRVYTRWMLFPWSCLITRRVSSANNKRPWGSDDTWLGRFSERVEAGCLCEHTDGWVLGSLPLLNGWWGVVRTLECRFFCFVYFNFLESDSYRVDQLSEHIKHVGVSMYSANHLLCIFLCNTVGYI